MHFVALYKIFVIIILSFRYFKLDFCSSRVAAPHVYSLLCMNSNQVQFLFLYYTQLYLNIIFIWQRPLVTLSSVYLLRWLDAVFVYDYSGGQLL